MTERTENDNLQMHIANAICHHTVELAFKANFDDGDYKEGYAQALKDMHAIGKAQLEKLGVESVW